MPLKENLLKYGVVSCRDLVELYYGWRMVAVAYQIPVPGGLATRQLLLPQDPRRIKYEIWMTAEPGPAFVSLGSAADLDNNATMDIEIDNDNNYYLVRSFLTDLDAVCQDLWFTNADGNADISVRAVILTPAPIDEVPLG